MNFSVFEEKQRVTLISCVGTMHMFLIMKKGFFITWVIYTCLYMCSYAKCSVCKNISNEIIKTPSNKSFKIECRSVLVTNAESCEYALHSSCVNFCSKRSSVPKYMFRYL